MSAARRTGAPLVVLLAACAGPERTPAPPDAELPALYPEPTGAGLPVEGADAALPWHAFFGDPAFDALMRQALAHNRDLRLAALRVDEAMALAGIQHAERFPNVQLAAASSRTRVPADLSPTGHSTIASQSEAAVSVTPWELDLWGRVRRLDEAALEQALATDEARLAVQSALVGQVALAYLGARELDERIDLTERTVRTRVEGSRIAHRRYEVGAAARIDAVQADVLLEQARTELPLLERQRALTLDALALLVGAPPPKQREPLAAIEPAFVRTPAPGLPSELLQRRPDLRAAERRLRAAEANVAAARAAFFPSILLTGAFGTTSAALDGLFGGGSGLWSFAPSITLPLFDGGRTRSGLELAEARRRLAIADYERSVQAAFRDVADALADRRGWAEAIRSQRAMLAGQVERSRIAGLRYRNGAAPYLEVLDAERERFTVEQALVQSRSALLASQVRLYVALGGGADRASAPEAGPARPAPRGASREVAEPHALESAPRAGPARPAPRGGSSEVAEPHALETAPAHPEPTAQDAPR